MTSQLSVSSPAWLMLIFFNCCQPYSNEPIKLLSQALPVDKNCNNEFNKWDGWGLPVELCTLSAACLAQGCFFSAIGILTFQRMKQRTSYVSCLCDFYTNSLSGK